MPTPEKEPLSSPSAKPGPSASASLISPITERNVPKEVPTLVPETLKFQNGNPQNAYLIEGAIAVHEGLRVGRIVEDRIEWLDKQVPETNTWLGGSHISWIGGRWPDAVDVIYKSNNGRAYQPTYYPLTGKGNTIIYAHGGGWGDVIGSARVGESTLIAGVDMYNTKFATIRGPGVIRGRKTLAEAGCKPEEIEVRPIEGDPPAIVPRAFGATAEGTVISMGKLCSKRNVALEIWDKDKTISRIMQIEPPVADVEYYSGNILPGKGDDAWIRPNSSVVFHYVNGKLETLPALKNGANSIFVSPNGKLYAANTWEIHRWDDDHWSQIAHLPWPEDYMRFFADEKEQIWRSFGGVQIMREGKGTLMRDDCETPFVYLYKVSSENKPDFTFPATRKVLATFPEVADLTLVEFNEGMRRLGVSAKSKTQAEAVMAHVKANMKDENPRLMCYAPFSPRKIDIQAKK